MTPHTKVTSWIIGSQELTPTTNGKKRKRRYPDMLTPSSSGYSKRSKRCRVVLENQDWEKLANTPVKSIEGTTLLGTPDCFDEPDGSDSDDDFADGNSLLSISHEPDANDDTIVVSPGTYEVLPPHTLAKERVRREDQAASLSTSGWPAADVTLFRKLDMRGFEPLLPHVWQHEFSILPHELFTSDDERAFVKSLGKDARSDFRATKALRALFDLGPRLRDKLMAGLAPETIFKKAIQDYQKWSLVEAGLLKKGWVPVLAVDSGSQDMSADILLENMVKKLKRLEKSWNAASNNQVELPPLYGVIVSHTVMAFAAYVPESQDANSENNGLQYNDLTNKDNVVTTNSLRIIAMFDFGNARYDVWNAFAIAILVVHCRNVLMETVDARKGVLVDVRGRKREESDPDA